MTPEEQDFYTEQARRFHSSAEDFIRCAEYMAGHGERYAGVIPGMCWQGADRLLMLRYGEWTAYPLKEIAKAANATNRMTNITEDQRERAFLRKLQELEPLPAQGFTQGMRL